MEKVKNRLGWVLGRTCWWTGYRGWRKGRHHTIPRFGFKNWGIKIRYFLKEIGVDNMCVYSGHIFPLLCTREIFVPRHMPCGARVLPGQKASISERSPWQESEVCSCRGGANIRVVWCPLALWATSELKNIQLDWQMAWHWSTFVRSALLEKVLVAHLALPH